MRRPHLPLKQGLALLAHRAGWKAFGRGLSQEAWPIVYPLALVGRRLVRPNKTLITVVGSYGKSTTTAAVRQALLLSKPKPPERNSYTYLAWQVLKSQKKRELATVLEVGIDGPGQMIQYARIIRPQMTIVTSIGTEHHRSLKSLERTREEKAMMVRALPEDGIALLNGDDPNVRSMSQDTRGQSISFGMGKSNEIRADNLVLQWPKGIRFKLTVGGQILPVQSRLIAEHQIPSILAAVAAGLHFGVGLEELVRRLELFEVPTARMQRLQLPSGAFLLRDEVKSSLETVEQAIEVLRRIPARQKLVVLGDISEPPGSQGPIYREIGRRWAETADQCFIVSSVYQRYLAGARQVGRGESFHKCDDPLEAAAQAARLAGAGDVILVKGRDSQKMERVSLALLGHQVRCRLTSCQVNSFGCEDCPLLGTPGVTG